MPDRVSPRAFAAVFAVLFVLAAVPVLRSGILPLVDYPNHLARMELLARLPQDAVLQRYYVLAWAPLPNLAMDLTLPPLLGALPLAAAGKIFVLATFLLIAGGTALVSRVLRGHWSLWPCLAFLLLYNRLLLWGILNYLFGLGLALCALAAMIALGRRGPVTRLVVGALFALALYFAHLMALAVYAVLLIGVAASGFWRAPRAAVSRVAIAAAPFLVPAVLLVAAGGGGGAGGGIAFAAPWRKLDLLFSVFDNFRDGVPGYYSFNLAVLKDSPIRTVEDLKGKILATNGGGSVVDLAMRYVLKKHGLKDKKDYTVIEVSLPNMFPMLTGHKVDLISLNTNYMHDPKIAAQVRTLFEERDAFGVTEFAFYCARSEYLDRNRAALADFFEDIVRSSRWMLTPANRDEAIQMVAKVSKQSPDLLATYYLLPVEDDYRDPDSRPDVPALQRNLDAMLELGFLKSRVDAAKHTDLSLIDAAVQRVNQAKTGK